MAGGTHGWNRPSAARGKGGGAASPHAATLWRGIVAGAVIVALGCAVLWFVLSGGGRDEPRATDGRQGKRIVATARPKPPPREVGEEGRGELKMPKPSGKYIERREEVAAPQSLEELQSAMTNAPAERKVAFKNGAEQLIALATPSEPGGRVPPLPPITDESVARELKEAMGHVILAEDGDSEATLEKKVVVATAKDEFRELRNREGYTFSEYLNALRDQANQDADFLAEAHKMSEELYHDEEVSDEDYVKYRDQINKKLKERGLPEIE